MLCKLRTLVITPQSGTLDPERGNAHVSKRLLPDHGSACCGPVQRLRGAKPGNATRKRICTRDVRHGCIEAFPVNAGRDLDQGSVGGSEEGVGEGKNKMGRLPEAVRQTEARRPEELALPLQMHDELRLERLGVCVRRRGAGRGITRLVALDAASAVSRRPPANRSAFARHATIALLRLVVTAGLHLTLSEPARAADAKPDECGIASVYSTLSEETASGQDTSVNDRTAAHRALPFETLVRVDNQENGSSAVVRITDRGPFVSGRIIDVSQIAAHELGFAGLAQVCLKILSLPGKPPVAED